MLSDIEKEHYSRHLQLNDIGTAGQLKLKQSKILVVGAGGLGCSALLYLTAAGIGTIGVMDFDRISRSNLQRQTLFGSSTIGKLKVEVAIARLKDLNPNIKFNDHPYKLDHSNACKIIAKYDLIVDCTDNFQTRFIINDTCVLNNKTFIYGAIYKFEGQVAVFNYNNGPTYRCLFPDQNELKAPNCAEIGVISTLPGIIGTMQANEAIKLTLNIGKPLSGQLLIYNCLTCNFSTLKLHKKDHLIYNKILKTQILNEADYSESCDSSLNTDIQEINTTDFINLLTEDVQLIDVREPNEFPHCKELNMLNIPVKSMSSSTEKISRQKKVIFICQSGKRSKMALQLIKSELALSNVYSLKEGLSKWAQIKEHISHKTTLS